MAEQEPKVAPIIRLPQIRAGRGTPSVKMPGSLLEPGRKRPEAPGGEAEAEDVVGDEAELQFSLKSQISGDQPRFSGESAVLRGGVSTLLRRALLNFAEQERQRTRMVTVLVAVQAALLLAVFPGYVFGQFQLSGVLVTVSGLALFGVVWLLNWMGRTAEASFLLVLGGVALVVLNMLLSAAQLVSLETLHISLLFLLVILSSGILFSPETAFVLSVISALFTTLVLLLFHPSGSLAAVFNAQGYYLSLVYLALIPVGVGVVAWLFGRQMQESIHLITYVSGLNMSNKRLLKRLREADEQNRHLEAGIAIIQQTHARVAAGDYSARAHVEGELLPLAVSLNLMLERVESFVHGEYERERMETAVAGLAELAGRVGEESQARLPAPTGTALDGLSIAIKQMQSNVNQRLAKVQQATTALMTTVGHCQDGLLPVAEVLQEHLRSIDALVLAADNVMNSAQRQIEFATQAEQLLLAAAPADVDLKVVEADSQQRKGTSALRLAEEMERRAALANEAKAAAAVLPEPAPGADAQTLPEAEAVPGEGSAAAPATTPEAAAAAASEVEVAAAEEAAPAQEEQMAEAEAASSPEGQAAEAEAVTSPEGEVAEAASSVSEPAEASAAEGAQEPAAEASDQPAGEEQAPAGEEPKPAEQAEVEQVEVKVEAEQVEAEPALDDAAALVAVEEKKITLADVDREAAEEVALLEEPDWDVEQLRELVKVLGSLAGEATQQERNARTLTFKLRAMLQGMPNTRRVDMMAAWLGTALEAVSQSAAQVQQASKTIPASAFQPARKGYTELSGED